ncbi:hypothetical protein GIB67_001880, partial [Kingdonia uniflora]
MVGQRYSSHSVKPISSEYTEVFGLLVNDDEVSLKGNGACSDGGYEVYFLHGLDYLEKEDISCAPSIYEQCMENEVVNRGVEAQEVLEFEDMAFGVSVTVFAEFGGTKVREYFDSQKFKADRVIEAVPGVYDGARANEIWRQTLKKALANEGMGDMGDPTFEKLFEQNKRFFTIAQQGPNKDYQEDLVSTVVTLENVVIARREKMAKKKKIQELLFQPWTKSFPAEEDTLLTPYYQLVIPLRPPPQAIEETEEEEEEATNPNPPHQDQQIMDRYQQTPQRVAFPLAAKRP